MSGSHVTLYGHLGSLLPERRLKLPQDLSSGLDETKSGKRLVEHVVLASLGDDVDVKRVSNPSPSEVDAAVSLIPGGDRAVSRATGGRGGNLARLLRWWRPRMLMEGGFRRCLVTLADHPELYPLENICAWLHHETTGLWPNEGCHHPGMKNCRRGARRIAASKLSESDFSARLRKLKPGKKAATATSSRQADIDFRALAYMTASGIKVRLKTASVSTDGSALRVKTGLVSSNSRVTRALESLVSYGVPGDMSRVRNPVRSTIARAVTPGGGRDRIGGETRFRCPPGFANGGKFTDRRFSTCGPRLFEQSGVSDTVTDATRSGARAAASAAGSNLDVIGAEKPKKGDLVTPGDYRVPKDIARAAEVAVIAAANPKRVNESIVNNASLTYEERGKFGKLVRRDGSVMDLSAPISRIVEAKNTDDMRDGFLISRVDDPTKMGDAEIASLQTSLKGFVLALPDNNHVKVSKTDRATPAAMKGAVRRFNALKNGEDPLEFGSALLKVVDESKGSLAVDFHMPNIKNPREVIQIQRDGAVRTVVRWVFQLFLAQNAPARNKASKPWTVVTAENA